MEKERIKGNRDKELPLGEHLEELRRRIILSLIAIVIFGGVAYVFRGRLLNFLLGLSPARSMIYLHPTEAFLTYLKLAGISGIVLSTPWILYQVWRFIFPALLEKETRYLRVGFLAGGVAFYIGVGLALIYGVPLILTLLSRVGGASLEMRLSIRNYVSFVSLLCFSVGLVFEIPLIILLLVRAGIVSAETLRRNRKYAITIAFAVAAFLTPTDVFSQALMAVPLVLLYEFSVLLVRYGKIGPR